ncbi:MAG: hypothetical protein ACLTX6_09915 [Lachnospiraceae bacterium]
MRVVHGIPINGDKIGQGRENAKIYSLKEHPEICDEIEKQVGIHYDLLPERRRCGSQAQTRMEEN